MFFINRNLLGICPMRREFAQTFLMIIQGFIGDD